MKYIFSSTLKFVTSFAMVLSIVSPVQASLFPGSGMPTDRCAYNASPQRIYAPPALTAAKEAIANQQKKIDRVKEKIKKIEKKDCIKRCQGRKGAVSKAIKLVDSKDVEDAYIDHLSCSEQYTGCGNDSPVAYYNKWAEAYGLALIYNDNNNYSRPNRFIASEPRHIREIRNKEQCESYAADGKRWVDGGCYQCPGGLWDGTGCQQTNSGPRTSPRPTTNPREDREIPRPEPVVDDGGGDTDLNCAALGKVDVGGRCCPEGMINGGSQCVCPIEGDRYLNGACRPSDGGDGGGGDTEPPPPVVIDPVDPRDSECQRPDSGRLDEFVAEGCSISTRLCEEASRKKGFSGQDLKNCRYCLKPTNSRENGRYSHCLAEIKDLEVELADLEDGMEELEDALDEVNDDIADGNSEASVCVDCLKDNRGFFERYGPTLIHAGIAGYSIYQGNKQYKKIWEDNNAKGYTSDPRGGYSLAAMGLGQGLGVLNTAVSTGAFGCAMGGGVWGQGGMVGNYPGGLVPGQAGGNVFGQIGGALGLPGALLGGINGGFNNSGGIYNAGGAGPWGQSAGYGINTPFFPGSVFGPGGNLNGGFGLNGEFNGGVDAEALRREQARIQSALAVHESRQAALRDASVLHTRFQKDLQAVWAGTGIVDGINNGSGNYGVGNHYNAGYNNGSMYGNGQFSIGLGLGLGVGGNTPPPLRPFGGDPNMTRPSQPTNSGLPSGIPGVVTPNSGIPL